MSNSNWPSNRLLLALPSRDLKRLMPELEHIRCGREQVLTDADSSLDHVFFPDSGVVSVLAVYADGSVIEMARSVERVAQVCKPSSAPRLPLSGFWSRPGSAVKMSRATHTGDGVNAILPSSCLLHAFLSRSGVGVQRAHSLKQRMARWLFHA